VAKTLQGYKVVRVVGDKRMSIIIYGRYPRSIVEYKVNEWVYPRRKCGPLCVFSDSSEAYLFMINQADSFKFGEGELYLCEYVPSPELAVWTPSKANYPYPTTMPMLLLPYTTKLAKKVKLIELVRKW
jgi:hypothetical protein